MLALAARPPRGRPLVLPPSLIAIVGSRCADRVERPRADRARADAARTRPTSRRSSRSIDADGVDRRARRS